MTTDTLTDHDAAVLRLAKRLHWVDAFAAELYASEDHDEPTVLAVEACVEIGGEAYSVAGFDYRLAECPELLNALRLAVARQLSAGRARLASMMREAPTHHVAASGEALGVGTGSGAAIIGPAEAMAL